MENENLPKHQLQSIKVKVKGSNIGFSLAKIEKLLAQNQNLSNNHSTKVEHKNLSNQMNKQQQIQPNLSI
ncbi:MAG: hypothetical protein PW786_10530 [Arachidicoccus sp.]|nr:hypothetical protein [Arachidicoccus sp.]